MAPGPSCNPGSTRFLTGNSWCVCVFNLLPVHCEHFTPALEGTVYVPVGPTVSGGLRDTPSRGVDNSLELERSCCNCATVLTGVC